MKRNLRFKLAQLMHDTDGFVSKSKLVFYKVFEPYETINREGEKIVLGSKSVILLESPPTTIDKYRPLYTSPDLFEVQGYFKSVDNVTFSAHQQKCGGFTVSYTIHGDNPIVKRYAKVHINKSKALTSAILHYIKDKNNGQIISDTSN